MATEMINRRASRRWTGTTVVLGLLAFAGAWKLSGPPSAWATVVVLGAALLMSGELTLDLPNGMSIAPSSVVLLAAVSALPSQGRIVGVMLVGACDGIEWKRLRARKYRVVMFNAAQVALAGLGATLVYDSTGGDTAVHLFLTSLAYLAINYALVIPVIAFQTGRPLITVFGDFRMSTATDLAFGMLGLFVGQLYPRHGAITVLLIVGPAIVARTVFQSVVQFRHAYERLESLYGFTRQLEASRDDDDPAATMLRLVHRRLGARRAELVVLDGTRWRRSIIDDSDGGLVHEQGDTPLPAGYPGAIVEEAGAAAPCTSTAVKVADDQMTAPLRVDGRLIGALAVTGTHELRAFTPDDLRLLETLANHVAVSLERNQLVERLRQDSYHDQLTALPNRRRFIELIAAAPRPTAIMLIDLDRFKEVNDALGHDHGDLLLVSVAERLRSEFGGSVVARLGGDEFGVLLGDDGGRDPTRAAVQVLSSLEQPFSVGVLDLEVTASIGVAVASDDQDAAKLLQQADVAMYSAKEAHSGWEVYSASRDHYSPWRLSLAGDLRRGITAGELEVHFQPKCRLVDGSVCGLEALVRWQHPRYGLLSPEQFIPVAEHAGLIRPVTMDVLATSCEQQTRLRDLGFALDIAINLSVRSVLDVNLPDQIAEVLSRHGAVSSSLTLEITEGSLMADPTRTIGVLGRLAALGISISIDDFGTGYSSLGYLRRLPAKEVKIDRSFVSGMLTNPSDEAIVRSTVDLAHNLGLRAVAEGVEDPETWARLGSIGCDEAQGYFLSAPLSAEALLPWLLRNRTSAIDPGR